MTLIASRLLADVSWLDPTSRALVLNTGTEVERDSKEVDDAIGLVSGISDDSAWRILEVISSLDGNMAGELVSAVVWRPSEIGTATDTLGVICEIVSGSSTVVGEISEALVEKASRDVRVGRTSLLKRLALIVTPSEGTVEAIDKDADSESAVEETTNDSIMDAVEVNSTSKLVAVVSRSG